jgi:hypothetical protein
MSQTWCLAKTDETCHCLLTVKVLKKCRIGGAVMQSRTNTYGCLIVISSNTMCIQCSCSVGCG